jgi:hypothetical protein
LRPRGNSRISVRIVSERGARCLRVACAFASGFCSNSGRCQVATTFLNAEVIHRGRPFREGCNRAWRTKLAEACLPSASQFAPGYFAERVEPDIGGAADGSTWSDGDIRSHPELTNEAALFPMRQPHAVRQGGERNRGDNHPAGAKRHVPMIDRPCDEQTFDHDCDPRNRHEPAQPNRRMTDFQRRRYIHWAAKVRRSPPGSCACVGQALAEIAAKRRLLGNAAPEHRSVFAVRPEANL